SHDAVPVSLLFFSGRQGVIQTLNSPKGLEIRRFRDADREKHVSVRAHLLIIAHSSLSSLTDALGSTHALAGDGGTVVTQYMYEPFGDGVLSGGFNANPARFSGGENDGGLCFPRARSPQTALHPSPPIS